MSKIKLPPTVKEEDERPNGKGSGKCFYCTALIGEYHDGKCPLWKKQMLVRMTLEYPVEVPNYWTKEDLEFHRNEGTWCGDNAIQELKNLPEETVCANAKFEYVKEVL